VERNRGVIPQSENDQPIDFDFTHWAASTNSFSSNGCKCLLSAWDLLLTWDNGNQQWERDLSALSYSLSLLWLLWCPRMRFEDNQSLHIACIMNPWLSSYPKPPSGIDKPSPVCWPLNALPTAQCLTWKKYSVNFHSTNEYFMLPGSSIFL
jgi:hypothetical protein